MKIHSANIGCTVTNHISYWLIHNYKFQYALCTQYDRYLNFCNLSCSCFQIAIKIFSCIAFFALLLAAAISCLIVLSKCSMKKTLNFPEQWKTKEKWKTFLKTNSFNLYRNNICSTHCRVAAVPTRTVVNTWDATPVFENAPAVGATVFSGVYQDMN